ncbi:MAG: hypothetical protein J5808_07785 [Paludibacteraceae bacterium]|nr:hypothetical protein [Paludibacteraceae bacterium]
MEQLIGYLKKFLLRDQEVAQQVGYTSDETQFANYKVVIRPSGVFDCLSEPKQVAELLQPDMEYEGLPVLFGSDKSYQHSDTLVIEADMVATAYYLLSRYEEQIIAERDEHGRFTSSLSWLGQCGWLDRPLVDAYGEFLHLRVTGKQPSYCGAQLCLTHDLDRIVKYATARNWLGGIRRMDFAEMLRTVCNQCNDPYWTACRDLASLTGDKPDVRQVFFVYTATHSRCLEDSGCVPLECIDESVLQELKSLPAEIGVHFSYAAGCNKSLLDSELQTAHFLLGRPISSSRYHFLANLKASDLEWQESIGITDEYTAGYADRVGFRLGTCRPVRFMSPLTGRLSNLYLHPLAAMDRTLADSRYMGLGNDEALRQLIELKTQVKHYGGELNVLWHNSMVADSASQLHLLQQLVEAW